MKSEKFYTLNITVRKDWEYTIYPGGVFVRPHDSHCTRELIHWFPVKVSQEILETQDRYDYYLDDSGSVYRRPVNEPEEATVS